MPVEMLTYGDLAARLEISVDAARAVARRLHLPRSLSSDGCALVRVDVGKIGHRRRPPVGRNMKIETLLAEFARLASTVATHRAEFERERERADRLAAQLLTLTAEAMSAKQATARLEGELAALRVGPREQSSSRLGRLTASVVQADRKACR
jgi:hypothetical protein